MLTGMVSSVVNAFLIGVLAAAPLLVGAWLALRWKLPALLVGLISAFGAGALISAVSFELVLDAIGDGDPRWLAVSLALGSFTYYQGSRYLDSRSRSGGSGFRGLALLMGAALDGIPESFILGISLAGGAGISLPFLMAVFVSNLPEGMASAAELRDDPEFSETRILGMWLVVILVSAAMAVAGLLAAAGTGTSGPLAKAFAAGALLTMLINDLVPEARERAGIQAGIAGVVGFAVAVGLHQLGS